MLSIRYMDGQVVNNPVDWNLLSSIPIRFIDYQQNNNKTIRLIGYEKYLKIEEIIPTGNKLILVGQNGSVCEKITLINNMFKKEEVTIDAVYNNQPVSESAWKIGFKTSNPSIVIK